MQPPSIPAPTIGYAAPNQASAVVKALTILLLVLAVTVTLRHVLYWTFTLAFALPSMSVKPLGLMPAGFAALEIAGYVVAATAAQAGLRGTTPAPRGLIVGAFIVAGAMAIGGLATALLELMDMQTRLQMAGAEVTGRFILQMAWRLVSSVGGALVPGTIALLLLRIKP